MRFAIKLRMVAATLAALAPLAVAQAKTVSGTSKGITWTASSDIVGIKSTGTLASGGSPMYVAPMPQYSGVAALIMDYGSAGRFICSGSLLSDRRSILTAGHCVSGSMGAPLSTTAYFYGGPDPDQRVPLQPQATAVAVSDYFVNPDYSGEVVDENDIAVVRLADLAPAFAQSYEIYDGGDLTGSNFTVAGYGARSDTGGTVGANLGTGLLRRGDNRYDFRLGDSDFGGFFTDVDPMTGENFFGAADVGFSFLSDFDDGFAANDASCRLALALGLAPSPKYCDFGIGPREASTAGGDSGGPQFINGMIASITSYGLSFGPTLGDYDNALNSSYGEFNGFVPTYTQKGFIQSVLSVPEPATWAMMIVGMFGLGAVIRRRRAALAAG
jgi:hypothetical protein